MNMSVLAEMFSGGKKPPNMTYGMTCQTYEQTILLCQYLKNLDRGWFFERFW